ncbi:hypothetical protein LCGC14_1178710 [marine sediment metagenome]|uniref:Uncharacterized protein n=1 Tax=marine sediment metagenome TaxID=412755 RepID=A0A0F9LMW7_9ZZZZ|nr:hypothetical protein [Pricia sp.]
MAAPLVNGQAFSYVQITPLFLGVPLVSMSSITYEETQEKSNNFGTGNRPVSRGHAAIEATGSIELSMNDIEAMREVAPNGSLLQIPASDFVLVFGNPQNIQTHVLKNLEFTNDGGTGTQGDTDLKLTLNFVISHVQYR